MTGEVGGSVLAILAGGFDGSGASLIPSLSFRAADVTASKLSDMISQAKRNLSLSFDA